ILLQLLDVLGAKTTADEPLGAEDRPGRVDDRLPLGDGADQPLAVGRKGQDRGCQGLSGAGGDGHGMSVHDRGDDGIRRPQVDPDRRLPVHLGVTPPCPLNGRSSRCSWLAGDRTGGAYRWPVNSSTIPPGCRRGRPFPATGSQGKNRKTVPTAPAAAPVKRTALQVWRDSTVSARRLARRASSTEA